MTSYTPVTNVANTRAILKNLGQFEMKLTSNLNKIYTTENPGEERNKDFSKTGKK